MPSQRGSLAALRGPWPAPSPGRSLVFKSSDRAEEEADLRTAADSPRGAPSGLPADLPPTASAGVSLVAVCILGPWRLCFLLESVISFQISSLHALHRLQRETNHTDVIK